MAILSAVRFGALVAGRRRLLLITEGFRHVSVDTTALGLDTTIVRVMPTAPDMFGHEQRHADRP